MAPIFHDVEQVSDEWFALRLGKLTSTGAADMLAEIKSGEAASRRNLRCKIMLERITGAIADDGWSSKAMDRGLEMEPAAIQAYEALQGVIVRTVGFVTIDGVAAGASPDGLVGDDGLIEAKCPLAATHLGFLKTPGKPTNAYLQQCRHLLWVTGRDWCDWVSFHPNFPESLRSRIVRIKRDDVDIPAYEERALEFLAEVDVEEEMVRGMA